MICRVRYTKPLPTSYQDVEAPSPEEAANTFHYEEEQGIWWAEPGKERCCYAMVEVEGHGTWVARCFRTGIWRSGGVRHPGQPQSLADVEQRLGLKSGELSEIVWIGEETYSDAQTREKESRCQS